MAAEPRSPRRIEIRMPKLYVDTAHLINIWKVRQHQAIPPRNNPHLSAVNERAYLYIDHCLRRGVWSGIFFPAAAFDWVDGEATTESALEPASVIDSWPFRYELES